MLGDEGIGGGEVTHFFPAPRSHKQTQHSLDGAKGRDAGLGQKQVSVVGSGSDEGQFPPVLGILHGIGLPFPAGFFPGGFGSGVGFPGKYGLKVVESGAVLAFIVLPGEEVGEIESAASDEPGEPAGFGRVSAVFADALCMNIGGEQPDFSCSPEAVGGIVGHIQHRGELISIFGLEATGAEVHFADEVGIGEAEAFHLPGPNEEGAVYFDPVDIHEVFIEVPAPHPVLRGEFIVNHHSGEGTESAFDIRFGGGNAVDFSGGNGKELVEGPGGEVGGLLVAADFGYFQLDGFFGQHDGEEEFLAFAKGEGLLLVKVSVLGKAQGIIAGGEGEGPEAGTVADGGERLTGHLNAGTGQGIIGAGFYPAGERRLLSLEPKGEEEKKKSDSDHACREEEQRLCRSAIMALGLEAPYTVFPATRMEAPARAISAQFSRVTPPSTSMRVVHPFS